MAERAWLSGARVVVGGEGEARAVAATAALRRAGCRVTTCTRGVDVVGQVGDGEVDIVVLEPTLSDMAGAEVARKIRESAAADTHVPFVVLSAGGGNEPLARVLTWADDCIVEPFSESELLARLEAHLRRHATFREQARRRCLYQGLYDSAPYAYLSLTCDLAIASCNEAFERITGQARRTLLGRQLRELFAKEDRDALESYLTTVSRCQDEPREARLRLAPLTAGKPSATVSVHAVHVGDARGTPPILVVLQDIGRKVQLEQEQHLARMQLYRSARLTSLGMLASGVAHEFNNPLTAILGFSSSLLDRLRAAEEIPADELEEYLGVIHTETLRCRDVIEAFSSFALDREVHITEVSLHSCVQGAVRLLVPRLSKYGVQVENRLDTDVEVRADASRLGQVVVNVLTNVIDFCERGTRVVIEADPSSSDSWQSVALRISDDGPGISQEILPRVFDPFFTTKGIGRGTGLGLTMCHSIMKEFGGGIDVVSDVGKGTTVVLELPKAEAIPAAAGNGHGA